MNANDHDRAKRLDEYIDALNAGRPAPQVADDADLANLFETARDLHRLRAAEPARDDVPFRLAAALEQQLLTNPTQGTRRIESNDMGLFIDASSNGSLRPPDGAGNTYAIPHRPERVRQWAQFVVAAVAFVLIGVVLAQIIGGGSGEDSDSVGIVSSSDTSTPVQPTQRTGAQTTTVTVDSASPTASETTPSPVPTETVELPMVVPTEQRWSPTVEPTINPTSSTDSESSINPDFATIWVSPDYVTCDDEVVARGRGFLPGTTVVLYGGPLRGDNFGPVSDDIPVADNGSFETLLDVSRVFAQCRGADFNEEGMQYSIGADTGSTSTKEDNGGPSARTVITFSSTVPDEVKNRIPFPTCGTEVQRNETMMGPAVGPDEAMRECFANAVESGALAEFVSYQQMPEGHMITAIHRSIGDGNVDMLVDGTQDPVGSGVWLRSICVWNEMSNLEPFTFHWQSCDEPVTIE